MASIAGLCWTSSEELFADLDLDVLYARQISGMGAERCANYPYLLLVYTGKITIGISLGPRFDPAEGGRGFGSGRNPSGSDGPNSPWYPWKEPPE